MLRIKDPARTIPFYTDMFGFRLVDKYQFDSFSLYFLETPRPGDTSPKPEPGERMRRGSAVWRSALLVSACGRGVGPGFDAGDAPQARRRPTSTSGTSSTRCSS